MRVARTGKRIGLPAGGGAGKLEPTGTDLCQEEYGLPRMGGAGQRRGRGWVLDPKGLVTDLVEYSTVPTGPKERGHGLREKMRKVH